MRNPVFTIVIVALISGASWWWFQSAENLKPQTSHPITKKENIVQVTEAKKVAAEIVQTKTENSNDTTVKPAQNTQPDSMMKKQSVEVYNQLFQIAGINNGYAENVTLGDPIHVTNFDDAKIAPSIFSPLYASGKIVAISIFREFTPGKRELARMRNVSENWLSYPPVDHSIAQQSLLSQYPNLVFTPSPGYYYLEDPETPFYLFETNTGTEQHFYLVSALDSKNIQIKTTRGQDVKQENIPIRINASGLMEIDELKVANMSEDQLEQLKKEIEVTNKFIQDGIMKFDEDMNLIFDKRGN